MAYGDARLVAVCLGMVAALGSPGRGEPGAAPIRHVFLTGKPRMVVNAAVDGAFRRLAKADCQRVFTEFADQAGVPLASVLTASGETAAAFLVRLYFVDGDDAPACHGNEATAAFTTPGSRVVHVCGARFAERFARRTAGGEIVLIHELLHALGLSENPPTSAHITEIVQARCGD